MQIRTFGDIAQIDNRVQALLILLTRLYGSESEEVRAFEAEYNSRLARIGDAFRIENGDIDAESARELPLSTPLGIGSGTAVIEILEWLTSQLKLALGPVS